MAIGAGTRLTRAPGSPSRATFLELFFDVVYVVALALISNTLVDHLGWAGAAQALIVLMALWWVWSVTALVNDFYDARRPIIQVVTIGTMFGTLLMAAAVPMAFIDRGLVFAGAYIAIHICRGCLLVPALRGHGVRSRAIQFLFWFIVSAAPWLIGGVVQGPARMAWWAAALLIDYGMFALGYPVPGRGRVPTSQYRVSSEHLAERYQQFAILALGDIILVAGSTFAGSDFSPDQAAAFLLAFASAVLLWRIYVHQAGERLPEAIESATDSGRFARRAPYTQLVMIAGVVATAASAKITITQPLGGTRPGWVAIIVGGPALFLAGRARFDFEVFSRWASPMFVGLVVLLVMAPALVLLPPLLAAVVVNLVLAGLVTQDIVRSRRRPPEPVTPPL